MKIRRALKLLLALVLAVCLLALGGRQVEYFRGQADYSRAKNMALLPRLRPAPRAGEPDPNFALLAELDLAALQGVNPDVKGWIVIPDTPLSYPLLQGGNNQYYLNHTWQGNRNPMGAIFLDSNAGPGDFSTLIYGHRMHNETMFGSLAEYRDLEYWRAHPSVYLVSGEGISRYDIYAAYEAEVQSVTYRLAFPSEEDRKAFIAYGLERSLIDTGLTPSPDGSFLTLSTCTNRGYATRWVVQGVLSEHIPN